MTKKELSEELDKILVDDLDDDTKKEILINGFHKCNDKNCPFCFGIR